MSKSPVKKPPYLSIKNVRFDFKNCSYHHAYDNPGCMRLHATDSLCRYPHPGVRSDRISACENLVGERPGAERLILAGELLQIVERYDGCEGVGRLPCLVEIFIAKRGNRHAAESARMDAKRWSREQGPCQGVCGPGWETDYVIAGYEQLRRTVWWDHWMRAASRDIHAFGRLGLRRFSG